MGRIKELLETRLINASVLAKGIYPNLKFPEVYLNQKIKGVSNQKLTELDEERIEKYLIEKINDK